MVFYAPTASLRHSTKFLTKFGYSHNHRPRAGITVIISPRAGIMAIISPRADYETSGADYRNHSTKSARPFSIAKFEFQGDNGSHKATTKQRGDL